MKRPPVLFREESRPSRLLTWPLVFVGAGAVTWAEGGMDDMQRKLFVAIVIGAVPWALLLLEFCWPVIEVRETEVRFSFLLFYHRRIPIDQIQHWTIKTYRVQVPRFWRPPRHCVEFTMKDGSAFTITLAHPGRLTEAVERAKTRQSSHQYAPSSAKAE